MKKRSYIFAAAVTVAITLGIGLTTVPAYGQASYGKHSALQRRVSYELKTDNGGNSLCMNRSGQGTSIGTNVIAYNCGQSNDDFYFANLSTMCGGGTVTETCPFTDGSGLNAAYYGDPIVVEYAYNESKCVGGSSPSDASAKLESCPSDSGAGGGYSTIGVLVYSRGNNPAYQVIVNRNWSNRLYGAGGQCYGADCSLVVGAFSGYSHPLTLNVADSQVQQSHPQNAANYDVWGEVSY